MNLSGAWAASELALGLRLLTWGCFIPREMVMAIESTSTTTTVNRVSTPTSLGLLLGRIPIGLFFLLAGISKLYYGVDGFITANLPSAMRFLPEHLARNFLNAVPFIEIAVGSLVIVGLITRVAAAVMALLLVIFTVGATTLRPGAAGGPFHYNMVFLGLALVVMLCGPGWMSVDGVLFRPRRRVIVSDEVERGIGP